MEHQKIINLLDNTSNQLSRFRTKIWVDVNDEPRGICNANSNIRIITIMLRSSLCDYSGAYILAKGTVTVPITAAADADANNVGKEVVFKNVAPFTNCISEINNTQVDNSKCIDVVMPVYDLIEYSYNCSKTSGMAILYGNTLKICQL